MSEKKSNSQKKKKSSSVRHTRAVQRDRSKRSLVDAPDEQVAERLQEIIHPATLSQVAHFHQEGLRERTLTLPVMVALLLSLVWRQIAGVSELSRVVQREALLWATPVKVSQQALSQRLSSLPAALFAQILQTILPTLDQCWQERDRPVLPELAWAQAHYTRVVSVDGSTLDALIRKMGLLKDLPEHPLAGKMTALLDVCSRLPLHIWYEANPKAHDQSFWERIDAVLARGMLLIFDLGYTNFDRFGHLTAQGITFLTRAKKNLKYEVVQVLQRSAAVHDCIVWIGQGESRQKIRLIEVLYKGKWYRYLTNELDPLTMPVPYAVALYWQRWRIEDAYHIVKRLLGLAYFWSGSQNAVELQLWSTWMLYGILVDLTDDVAQALKRPFAAISMEMIYRSLYFFTQAHARGEADHLVTYLADNANSLGILKRKPPPGKLGALFRLTNPTEA
jgi:hypothetical protein